MTSHNFPVLVFEGIMSRLILQFTAVHKTAEVNILVMLATKENLAAVEGWLREMFIWVTTHTTTPETFNLRA